MLVAWSWKTLLNKLSLAGGLEVRLLCASVCVADLTANRLTPQPTQHPSPSQVTFYELDADFKTASEPVTVQLPDCSAPPHDSVLTEDFHVFMQYAFNLDLLPCLLGLKGPGECLVRPDMT